MKNKTIRQIGRIGMALAVALGTGVAPAPSPAAASAPQTPVETPLAAPQPALVLAPQAISLALQAPANPLSPISIFTVDVIAAGVTDLGAWEFDLAFDPTFFDVVELTAQPAFGQEANCNPTTTRCAYTLGPWVDGTVASVGGLTYGAGPAMGANGVVGRMKLQPRGKIGTTTISITQPLATNAAGDNQIVTGGSTTLVFAGAVNRVFLPSAQRTGAGLAGAEQESAKAPLPSATARAKDSPATAAPYCAPYDIGCDSFIDVRDLQTQAGLFGVLTGSLLYSASLDIDGNGIIDGADLLLNAGGWHSTPQQLAGGPPRLGYAVSITGAVFLRWTLPITPYVASVYVIRQDISGTTAYTPVLAGVVDPIYNEPLALSLLGTNWDTLRQLSFTTDISGVTTPATFTSVISMHQAFALNRGNLLAVSQLINTEPGVALVMGRGFVDQNRQTPTSKFWIRVKGRLLGPVTVDRTGRTIEPAPANLTAFDASGYITSTDPRERANQQRFAHGTVFLKWTPPNVGQFNPVWMYGYDVFRKSCNPLAPASCSTTVKVNTEPVAPRTNTRSGAQTVPITGTPGASLRFSGDVSDINFSYADRDLDPDILYCYRVAARDLLGQSGALSEEACLRGPDFRGPVTPQPVYAAAIEANGDVCEINLTVAWRRDTDAARYEIWRGTPPSGTAESAWVLIANVTNTTIVLSTTTNFDLRGGYAYTRYSNAGNFLETRPVNWRVSAQFNNALALKDSPDALLGNRLVFTNADPGHPTLTLTPTLVFTGTRSSQQGDKLARFDIRQALYIIDTTVSRGDRFRYRVVPYDARGNMGQPSAPAEMIARQKPGECLPAAPEFGQNVGDNEVGTINLYRKFGPTGQPVLISRIPRLDWNASSKQASDFYSPTVEMEVTYELRAENGYGELSPPGTSINKILTPAPFRMIQAAQPMIIDAQISKQNNGKFKATLDWNAAGSVAMNAFNIYMARGVTMPNSYLSMTLVYSGSAKSFEFTKTTVYSDAAGTANLTDTSKIFRHTFTNDDLATRPKLNGKDNFWFMVASRTTNKFICIGGPGNCTISYSPDMSSTQRAAIYVSRVDEPQRELDTIDLSLTSNALQTEVYLNWQKDSEDDFNTCCYVVMRSRDGETWTQLSPPFSAISVTPATVEPVLDIKFVDDDRSLSDANYAAFHDVTIQYQVLKLDAGGEFWFFAPTNSFDHAGGSGEIVAASPVVTFTRNRPALPGTSSFEAGPIPQAGHPGPAAMVFGADGSQRYTVEVQSASGQRTGGAFSTWAFTGTGRIKLYPQGRPLFPDVFGTEHSWVRVEFANVETGFQNEANDDITRTVNAVLPGGYANVMLGDAPTANNSDCYRVNKSGDNRFLLCDVYLDNLGMKADKLILTALGPEAVMWEAVNTGGGVVGRTDTHTFTNHLLDNMYMEWRKAITPSQDCNDPLTDNVHVVGHVDWPLLIVPKDVFTYTQTGIDWTSVCTRYRSARYSDRELYTEDNPTVDNTPHEPTDSGNQLENDGFLKPTYTANTFFYVTGEGFSGTLNHNSAYSYSLAFPFKMRITGDDWRVKFEDGELVSGHIENGTLRMPHSTNGAHTSRPVFDASFASLDVLTRGAVVGTITGLDPLAWATFSFTGTDTYDLFLPQAMPMVKASLAWPADRGNANSGLAESGLLDNENTQNAGINVFKRGLVWESCAAAGDLSSTGTITFVKTPNSGFKLYFRYGGASGQVNMTWGGSDLVVDLADYETRISRFSQSWLDNQPQVGATLGELFLPFPVSMTLDMIGMSVNSAGCMSGGPVLGVPGQLDWWNIDVLPSAAEWRTGANGNTDVWLLGEYEIKNLTRVDGVVNGTTLDDPTVPIELAFRPNGTFKSANAYPQPTVYEIDGFYSVIEEIKLSDCNPRRANGNAIGNSERLISVDHCDGPTGANPWTNNATFRPSPTATNQMSAYVDIVGSMVMPWFGEVISPSANHIYLLHRADYVGFSQRPTLEGQFSKLLPIGIALDLTFAQGKNKDGAWIGIAKQGAQRDALQAFSAPYAAVITPDNTTLVFGFPAMAAAMLGAQQMECDWDAARCNDASSFADWNTKWSNFRTKLGVGGGAYNGEYDDARRLADAVKDQKATLTAYNLLDAVEADLEATCAASACTDEEIAAWMDNTVQLTASPHARSALLRGFMAQSPLQVQWLRGSVSILGERDEDGRLVGGKVGTLHLDSYLTVFNRATLETAVAGDTTPMFDALVSLDIDAINNSFRISANGIDVKLVGNAATMNLDLEVYMGDPNGYGAHGSIELLNLHLALMDINEADADFGFTIKSGNLDELYLGVTFEANVQTGAFGSILVGGQFLVGRLDPDHPTLQEDFGDLFDDMDTNGNVIEGMYLSVYANNIPIVNIAGCLVAELSGGGGLAFWVFTDPAQNDTAWGTRVSGFVQGQGGACLVALAVNIDLTLDNGFGEDETKITGDLFVAGGCGFCEPEEWITERGYEDDKGCIKCGLNLGFVIPLDGSPAPYMVPEPQFSCSL